LNVRKLVQKKSHTAYMRLAQILIYSQAKESNPEDA